MFLSYLTTGVLLKLVKVKLQNRPDISVLIVHKLLSEESVTNFKHISTNTKDIGLLSFNLNRFSKLSSQNCPCSVP